MSQIIKKKWRTVQIPAGLLGDVEKHVAQKKCSHLNKSDFVRDAVRKGLLECHN